MKKYVVVIMAILLLVGCTQKPIEPPMKEDYTKEFIGAYNDGLYCPVCGKPMVYDYYHFNHVGKYRCTSCDFARHDTDFTVTDVNLDESRITINGTDEIKLAFKSIYNIYNILAAYAVCSLIGISGKEISNRVSNSRYSACSIS